MNWKALAALKHLIEQHIYCSFPPFLIICTKVVRKRTRGRRKCVLLNLLFPNVFTSRLGSCLLSKHIKKRFLLAPWKQFRFFSLTITPKPSKDYWLIKDDLSRKAKLVFFSVETRQTQISAAAFWRRKIIFISGAAL